MHVKYVRAFAPNWEVRQQETLKSGYLCATHSMDNHLLALCNLDSSSRKPVDISHIHHRRLPHLHRHTRLVLILRSETICAVP